ncbi:EcsC family protein [Heliobacterium chlorum]|nr:EcsC family protein [Heliobacterium chlorum]
MLIQWDREMLKKKTGLLDRMARQMQKKIDNIIPEKVHAAVATALEVAVKAFMAGVTLLPEPSEPRPATLQLMDEQASAIIQKYKKVAAIEGAGTGMGGILLAAIDFPALIAIKIKMLQEMAWVYGFDFRRPTERYYLIHLFLLAFASGEAQQRIYRKVRHWDRLPVKARPSADLDFNWREFYTEYREGIETKKTLGFIPVIGMPVSAWANFSLTGNLGDVAQNAFRLRYLQSLCIEELYADPS